MTPIVDYDLCKLFFDLQNDGTLAADFRRDRNAVLSRYQISDEVLQAVRRDDVVALARRSNPFLLRYYFFTIGMPEDLFLARLQPLRCEAMESKDHG